MLPSGERGSYGRRQLVRALGALYPPFVLLVVVATGNHFFFAAAAGVALLAAAAAALLTQGVAPTRISELPTRPEPLPAFEKLAA
jgi:PAP2 superfamily